jgi:polysaccharide export outer membrane protein
MCTSIASETGRVNLMKRAGSSLFLLLSAALAGCSQLPLAGPTQRTIVSEASSSILSDRRAVALDYVLLDIDQNVLEHVIPAGPGSFFSTFGSGKGPAPTIRVGVGDVIQVTVFESGAGGLFIPAEAGVRPGNFVQLPSQTVDRNGTITVPYAGEVRAAQRTLQEIQREIESKLANRAIEPQIIVSFVEQNATEVAVVGDVINNANKFKIRLGGERVLDMISRAGGIKYPGYESFVTLQRKGKQATLYFPRLISTPAENIFVAPGDAIYVYREQQKYVAVGALGTAGQAFGLAGQFTFDQEKLSLNEGVAKAGGLLDVRADPRQVFLYRLEFRDSLEKMGVDLGKFTPEQRLIPTIYRANYRDPSSFFFAQQFPMRHKDVIYVANADSIEFVKFLNYVSAITSTVAGTAVDGATTVDVYSGRHILGKD